MKNHDLSDIGYCGLFCGDCWVKKENISKPVVDLLNKAKTKEFKQLSKGLPQMIPIMKGLDHYDHFIEFLETACFFSCQTGCRSGGGVSDCQIRECSQQKSIQGCWECDEYKDCPKLSWLEPAHPGAAIKNIEIIRKSGIENYIKGEKYW